MNGSGPALFALPGKSRRPGPAPIRPTEPLEPCRNVPRGREPKEVIQANQVHVRQEGTHAVDAPSITSRTKDIPVVNGVTPQLSLRAEIVGGNPATKRGRRRSSNWNNSGLAQTSLESGETKNGRSPIKLTPRAWACSLSWSV
jgi:hypothetical protein